MRALKGMRGAPTSCATRSSVTEHGRASKTRVSWSRSSRSTQSDCCNGRTQTDRHVCRWLVDHRTSDQVRGRAGEGEQVTRWSGPARDARCGTPKQDGSSAEVHSGWSLESGLRSQDSRARLEGGRWKRAARYLAGGLPYFTSGLGEGEGCKALPYPGELPKFDSSRSQSDKLPPVNRSKFHREGACHARQRNSKPYQVGRQVSCRV